MTELRKASYAIMGAPLGEADPLPFFRDPEPREAVDCDEGVPVGKREGLGAECGFRVLPYAMQDEYSRGKVPMELDAVVLENDKLRATFLTGLGGRLASLYDKMGRRELLSRNPVFQPANLAIANAWFSGGIEWNIGHFGHSCHTCLPIFAAEVDGKGDGPVLRLYDLERMTGLFWQIDFRLPPGSPILYATTTIRNALDRPSPLYWWTNIALPEAGDVRVLAPAEHALYIDPTCYPKHRLGWARLPRLPSLAAWRESLIAGETATRYRGSGFDDGTYAGNSPFANEYFFQCESSPMPWEAAIDEGGRGFFECSTPGLPYRKLFCWGNHHGGRRWQEFLSEPGVAYLEIQAGIAPTQLHGATISAGTELSWTEAFGPVGADPRIVHGSDWEAAISATEEAIAKIVGADGLTSAHASYGSQAKAEPSKMVALGSGWGELELARFHCEGRPGPAGLSFPASSMGSAQQVWLALLETGVLPDASPDLPPSSWLCSEEWKDLLERSLSRPGGMNWNSLLHVGVARLEAFDLEGASGAFSASLAEKSSPWALRNLGLLSSRKGARTRALEYYRLGWLAELEAARRTSRRPCHALAEEFLAELLAGGRAVEARALAESLPPELASADRARLLRARADLALGDLDAVESCLEGDFAQVREGENALAELWFEVKARRLAAARGLAYEAQTAAAMRAEAERLYPPPAKIDFRMSPGQFA